MKYKELTFEFNGKAHLANYHIVFYSNVLLYWIYPQDEEMVNNLGLHIDLAFLNNQLVWQKPAYGNELKSRIAAALAKQELLEPYLVAH